MNLKHNELSHAVVGLWTIPLGGVPRLDPAVLANLFNEPYTTQIAMTAEGILVQKLGKPPVPTVVFGPAKFSVMTTSIPETARVLDAVMAEALKQTGQQIPLVRSLGLNTEHEWEKPAFNPSDRWLGNNYVRNGLNMLPPETLVGAANLQFRLTLSDRVYNIQLQPRAGNPSAIFGSINDHRDAWNKNAPTGEVAERLLKESTAEIENRLTPIILGGIAGA